MFRKAAILFSFLVLFDILKSTNQIQMSLRYLQQNQTNLVSNNNLQNNEDKNVQINTYESNQSQNNAEKTFQQPETSSQSRSESQPWYVIVILVIMSIIFIIIVTVIYKYFLSKYCCPNSWYYAPDWNQMEKFNTDSQLYSHYLRIIDGDDKCTICLSNRCDSITSCEHAFHFQCYAFWNEKSKNCPDCKKSQYSLQYFCPKCHQCFAVLKDIDMIQKCTPYLKEFPRCDNCYKKELDQNNQNNEKNAQACFIKQNQKKFIDQMISNPSSQNVLSQENFNPICDYISS